MEGISVIIPCFNRGGLIKHAIDSLMRQKRKPDEIIIVDDGSTDNTKEMVEELNNPLIRYYYRKSPLWVNPSVPLNIGIKKAKYDLIVFSLSDIVHIGENLERIEKKHKEIEDLYLIGSKMYWVMRDVNIPEKYWDKPEQITQLPNVKKWYNGFYSKDTDIVCQEDLYTSNIASCKKKHLFAVNGFDEDMTDFYGHEDSDLVQRLHNLGKVNPKDMDSTFQIIRDNKIVGIHQYHKRPPSYAVVGTTDQLKKVNENLLKTRVNLNGWGELCQ